MSFFMSTENKDHVFTVEQILDVFTAVFPEPLDDFIGNFDSAEAAWMNIMEVREEHPGAKQWPIEDVPACFKAVWESLEDVPFDEGEDDDLVLGQPWLKFDKGHEREDIWHWLEEEFGVFVTEALQGRYTFDLSAKIHQSKLAAVEANISAKNPNLKVVEILTTRHAVKKALKANKTVRVGQYTAFGGLKPSDALVGSEDSGYTQIGIEREGCDFSISDDDICDGVADFVSMVLTGKNTKGGNTAFCFFVSGEELTKDETKAFPEMTPVNGNWVPCTDPASLPVGMWLVKVMAGRTPYHVATVRENSQGKKIVTMGNYFHFDLPQMVGYSAFSETDL